ncbi:hypothetical protein NECAME_13223 [Necator americanus]|uniref:Tetraspanin family protein n=1 Tax=Necator americanus TaxID=51031 RepID=W2SWC7_NECAM|nr:hypothetical protein NECAME_13223 [Necator americanus]ETN74064.1 hypothetical protein NECAME_13223 [Necator americanus]
MIARLKCGYEFTQKALQSLNVFYIYMVILSCVFLIQFIVAIVCLGNVSETSLEELVTTGWSRSDEAVKWDAQKAFGCCGLDYSDMLKRDCKKRNTSACFGPSQRGLSVVPNLEFACTKVVKRMLAASLTTLFTGKKCRMKNQLTPKNSLRSVMFSVIVFYLRPGKLR